MYINISDNYIYTNPSLKTIDKLNLIYLNEEFQIKFKSLKYPEIIIENKNIIDIIENEELLFKYNEIEIIEKLKPTEKELKKAENKIEIINTLKEVGLIV